MPSFQAKGFSLIELVIVLVILSILATFLVLSVDLSGGKRAMQIQMNSAWQPFDRLCDEALISGRPWGLAFQESGWVMVSYLDQKWSLLNSETDQGKWPADYEWGLYTEGLTGEVWPGKTEQEDQILPQVICLPNGLRTPFYLQMQHEQLSLSIESQADGTQTWHWNGHE